MPESLSSHRQHPALKHRLVVSEVRRLHAGHLGGIIQAPHLDDGLELRQLSKSLRFLFRHRPALQRQAIQRGL